MSQPVRGDLTLSERGTRSEREWAIYRETLVKPLIEIYVVHGSSVGVYGTSLLPPARGRDATPVSEEMHRTHAPFRSHALRRLSAQDLHRLGY